ncbi:MULTISPECIES: hypothetical protein [Paenibacillus]|nr:MULTISPECIES: hypothetical protein [Paenibacillus]
MSKKGAVFRNRDPQGRSAHAVYAEYNTESVQQCAQVAVKLHA